MTVVPVIVEVPKRPRELLGRYADGLLLSEGGTLLNDG